MFAHSPRRFIAERQLQLYVSTRPASGAAVLWLAGMVLSVYGVGGAAAILTVKADFKVIHAAVLSASAPPVDQVLASSYARMMSTGENTVATRLTVFRHGAFRSRARRPRARWTLSAWGGVCSTSP